jgi:peptidoglycan/xylan/chitin deacetylase (PgdA/CDA1 family)
MEQLKIMPKNQAKIIYIAPQKRTKKPVFDIRMLVIQIAMGFVLAIVILGAENLTTFQAKAQQEETAATTSSILSSELLNTPTPIPSLPFSVTKQVAPSFNTGEITSEAAQLVPPEVTDYCMDMPIILYHHVQPLDIAEQLGHAPLTVDSGIFDNQMKYLHDNGYHAISSQDLVNALQTRTKLPEKSIMITVDDGYDDNYTYAFLSAKKYKMIVNFMIPTGLIDTPGYMNWDHLKEMAQSPYARIYNHTTSHAALGLISKEDIVKEVTTANEDLQNKLGIKNDIVTYPYGDYNDLAIDTLKELHIAAAFTTESSRQQCLLNIMKLPRLHIGNAPMTEYGF